MQFTVLSFHEMAVQNAKDDPAGFAAHMMGIDKEHPFFEISSALPTTLMMDDGTDFLQLLASENIVEGDFAVEPLEYDYSANMSDLFAPGEGAIDLNVIAQNAPEAVVNISDPKEFDSALIEAGTNEDIFNRGRKYSIFLRTIDKT